MRMIALFLAILCCSEAHAQSFPGFMPPQTVVCNNTAAEAVPANCSFISFPITSTSSAGWFLNDSPPAKISKFGDRVFMGDAVKYVATSPTTSVGNDWFSQWECTFGLCGGFIANSVLLVETSATNKFGTNAISGIAGTLPCLGVNCGAIGINGIGVNNVAATAGKTYNVWGGYLECSNQSNNTGQCTGLEIDLGQYWDYGHPTAYNPFEESKNTGILLFCGLGGTGNNCGSVFYIEAGTSDLWVSGLVIGANSIKPGAGPVMGSTGSNATVAVAMAEGQHIVWYQNSTTINAAIFGGTSGNLNLVGNNMVVNGTAAVSCGAGSVNPATMVVTNGIVTHC